MKGDRISHWFAFHLHIKCGLCLFLDWMHIDNWALILLILWLPMHSTIKNEGLYSFREHIYDLRCMYIRSMETIKLIWCIADHIARMWVAHRVTVRNTVKWCQMWTIAYHGCQRLQLLIYNLATISASNHWLEWWFPF